jgi:hypothetical protein
MIHRDFCNPYYTKDYSPLRMQFHFLLSRYVCLDGFIPLTRKEMADRLSCDIQSVDKFIKKGIQENILKQEGEHLILVKRIDEYQKGYVKHFAFLESDDFKNLKRHTQRFVLYTLWAGVHHGRPLKREISALFHSTAERIGILNIYDKASLYPVLEEAKRFLNLEIINQRGREMVRVKGLAPAFCVQETLDNQGEQKWLDDLLFEECCDEMFNSTMRIELLKLKKHYWTSFQGFGLELFWHGLKKLLSAHKLMDVMKQGERTLGSYFHSILEDMEKKLLPTLQRCLANATQALQVSNELFSRTLPSVLKRFDEQKEKLQQMIQLIQKKWHKTDPPNSFPFYNWLETQS